MGSVEKVDKTKAMAVIAIIVAIASVFLFTGMTNNFSKKINYLSDKYAIFECKIKWEDYPSEMNKKAMFRNYEYEVHEAKSWTAFKSLIRESKEDGTLICIFYEPESHMIWFDKYEWINSAPYYGGAEYRYTTLYIRG